MRVAVICHDKPGALQTRIDTRAAHLAHIETSGVVEMAGPFLDETGAMKGSLIVLNIETIDAARIWAEANPYAAAGLFDRVTILEWKKVIG